MSPSEPGLSDRIDAVLPQTQCTRCGYPDCRSYAAALAETVEHWGAHPIAATSAARDWADINQCPPGGMQGVDRLASVTGRRVLALDEARGTEGPLRIARIDEAWCIGCMKCIDACPVDCIVGAPKAMHTVVQDWCTGCELCIAPCPVDCIELEAVDPTLTGWDAWSQARADESRERYRVRTVRRGEPSTGGHREHDDPMSASSGAAPAVPDRAAVVAAALARARAQRGTRST